MTTATPDTTDVELVREVTPSLGAIEQQARGEIDLQIATAKRYPRSIKTFMDQAQQMATLTEEIAESCFYALPRDGKTIEGPSARLAEICASAWGHMRIEGRLIDEDDRFVTARGTAWDLQNNVAIGYEVRRRITDKQGRRYKDDMIGVTANAATSIALRNAILKIVPSPFWRPIYEQCRRVAVGDAQTLADRRVKMLAHFQKMGVPDVRVYAQIGVAGVEDITLEHLATLKGLATAIKEGDTTVDEAFPAPLITPPHRRSDSTAAAAAADVVSAGPDEDGPGVRITDVTVVGRQKGKQVAVVTDEHGIAYRAEDALVLAAVAAKERGTRVTLVAVKQGEQRILEELVPVAPVKGA